VRDRQLLGGASIRCNRGIRGSLRIHSWTLGYKLENFRGKTTQAQAVEMSRFSRNNLSTRQACLRISTLRRPRFRSKLRSWKGPIKRRQACQRHSRSTSGMRTHCTRRRDKMRSITHSIPINQSTRSRVTVVLVVQEDRDKYHLKWAAITLGRAIIHSRIVLRLTLRSNNCVQCRSLGQVEEGITDNEKKAGTKSPWRLSQIII